MLTLVPGSLLGKYEVVPRLTQASGNTSSGDNSRHVALLGALVLLFVALVLLRRAFQPLRVVRDVFLPVIAAVVGAMLVLAAFVLLITAMLPWGSLR
jgi:protein-S-isoprenylcysteine O-methyltransferase Ste14